MNVLVFHSPTFFYIYEYLYVHRPLEHGDSVPPPFFSVCHEVFVTLKSPHLSPFLDKSYNVFFFLCHDCIIPEVWTTCRLDHGGLSSPRVKYR